MELRPYQRDAVDAVWGYLRWHDDNPCVVIPTAGGKTPIMATLCREAVELWRGRVLIVAHVRELLEQAAHKLRLIAPGVQFGVYSAGLARRDVEGSVLVAGLQSAYRNMHLLGAFDLILVDECHRIPPSRDGMYQQLIAAARDINPDVRVVGFTATPFRLSSGPLCGPDSILNAICYEIGVADLVRDGYICRLTARCGTAKADLSGVRVRAGEFVDSDIAGAMDQTSLVESACRDMLAHTANRRSCLAFATSIEHGRHIAATLRNLGASVEEVYGETKSDDRDRILGEFKAGGIKFLVSCEVLTTGFDAPNIDAVAMLRPTMSPGLYYQMVGRGFRLHPGKENCLVLDFAGNILRHGPVDALSVAAPEDKAKEPQVKECPGCHLIVPSSCLICEECGHRFPAADIQDDDSGETKPREIKHAATAASVGILSGESSDDVYEVIATNYSVHYKRDALPGHPPTMCVEYVVSRLFKVCDWVCLEHRGYARQRAEKWWKMRSRHPIPDTVEEAVWLAENGALAETLKVTVSLKPGEKYYRVTKYDLGPKPDMPIQAPDAATGDLAYCQGELNWQDSTLDLSDIPF